LEENKFSDEPISNVIPEECFIEIFSMTYLRGRKQLYQNDVNETNFGSDFGSSVKVSGKLKLMLVLPPVNFYTIGPILTLLGYLKM